MMLMLCAALICACLVKIHLLRKSAREIETALADRLAGDTNTLIDISSRDRCMTRLAASLNTRLRDLRERRRRYEQGDTELKNAVTNISHDLRTPLTAIFGYLDLLEKETLSENAARYVGCIGNRAEAMRQLTEELFRYSVVLSQNELQIERVDVSAVLEQSIGAFYDAFTARGIAPDIRICPGVIRSVDRAALTRVFGNLLSNALKYSDGDLSVCLCGTGEAVFSNKARALTGVEVGRLFDRFFSVETASSPTGLGLSIAKTLTERMKGSITASYSDKTLSITLSFPQ